MNLFNARCVICSKSLVLNRHGLCCRCNKTIARFPYCGNCGIQLFHDSPYCGKCLYKTNYWDQLVIISNYTEPLSGLIHRFKYYRQFWLDRTLARLLLLAIVNAKRTHHLTLPEIILPVPLHRLRYWYRGYNQAELLARYVSTWLKIPLDTKLVARNQYTRTQLSSNAKMRALNLKNSFIVNHSHCYQSVAIVDDVITTGATANEMAKQLKASGVKKIQIWALCRV